jgi:hypothetical protein
MEYVAAEGPGGVVQTVWKVHPFHCGSGVFDDKRISCKYKETITQMLLKLYLQQSLTCLRSETIFLGLKSLD